MTDDQKTIVSGCTDRSIFVWNCEDGQIIRKITGFYSSIISLSITPNQQFIVGNNDDNIVKIWDLKTGQVIKRMVGHNSTVLSTAVSRDGKYLVSGGSDNAIKIWNLDFEMDFVSDISEVGENSLTESKLINTSLII